MGWCGFAWVCTAGLAYPRDGDYVAFAVHQAARVVSAANGGQIVVSEHAAALAGAVRRGDASRRPGRFPPRDFDEPVELFGPARSTGGMVSAQVKAALRALPADGRNLVRPRTSADGRRVRRQRDIADELTGSGRLVSIVGPGGVGKTRLVVELGFAALPRSMARRSVVRRPLQVISAIARCHRRTRSPTPSVVPSAGETEGTGPRCSTTSARESRSRDRRQLRASPRRRHVHRRTPSCSVRPPGVGRRHDFRAAPRGFRADEMVWRLRPARRPTAMRSRRFGRSSCSWSGPTPPVRRGSPSPSRQRPCGGQHLPPSRRSPAGDRVGSGHT